MLPGSVLEKFFHHNMLSPIKNELPLGINGTQQPIGRKRGFPMAETFSSSDNCHVQPRPSRCQAFSGPKASE